MIGDTWTVRGIALFVGLFALLALAGEIYLEAIGKASTNVDRVATFAIGALAGVLTSRVLAAVKANDEP